MFKISNAALPKNFLLTKADTSPSFRAASTTALLILQIVKLKSPSRKKNLFCFYTLSFLIIFTDKILQEPWEVCSQYPEHRSF